MLSWKAAEKYWGEDTNEGQKEKGGSGKRWGRRSCEKESRKQNTLEPGKKRDFAARGEGKEEQDHCFHSPRKQKKEKRREKMNDEHGRGVAFLS